MERGFLAGYPIVDLKATIYDGKEHPVDSSEMAFKLAARGCLREAMKNGAAVMLEPIMLMHVFADEAYIGDILSNLSSKRARIQGQESIGGGITQIDAEVPQSEIQRYAIELKALYRRRPRPHECRRRGILTRDCRGVRNGIPDAGFYLRRFADNRQNIFLNLRFSCPPCLQIIAVKLQ